MTHTVIDQQTAALVPVGLDHKPISLDSLTVAHVVASGYGWANGDLRSNPGTLRFDQTFEDVTSDDTTGTMPDHFGTMGAFLLCETAADGPTPNSPEHWAEARRRMAQVLREVQAVCGALDTYGPQGE